MGLAEKLLLFFRPGDIIVLSGELGAGKTVFVRGMARGLGIDEELVNSPSFTIVNEYPGGQRKLYHFDLYRLGDRSELHEIGWNDYQQRDGIMVVEWGEKAEELMPSSYYLVEFETIDSDQRKIEISHIGE